MNNKAFDRSAKRRIYLSGRDFYTDMKTLRILGSIRNPQKRVDEYKDETPQFITYLTLALQNISEIIGHNADLSGMRDASAVSKTLAESGRLYEVASFLWLHRATDPERDFGKVMDTSGKKEYETLAIEIIVKLWELRNMFVHAFDRTGLARALIVSPDFRRFVEGELYGEACEHALGPGRKSEKVFKLKLFNPNDDARSRYEFTRKGLIYLICLALYRHDAAEFIQQFSDMQLPPRDREVESGLRKELPPLGLLSLQKKCGTVKAIIDSFTYYSMRSSRTDIDVQNADYLNFANILLYLNKVPMASYDYLSLDTEAKALADAAAQSTESEENRRFKYLLQPRRKDRFLTLALAYIEDFDKLRSLKFKRLDITMRPERGRYMFGKIPEDATNELGDALHDANGMDRHYAIKNGVAQFEYVPRQHYGAIKISRLRGGISEDELMRLLLVMHDGTIRGMDPNRVIDDYLSAYHRILERMLNAEKVEDLSLDDPQYRADFKLVTGKGDDAFAKGVFVEAMKPFFSANITRYFVGESLKPDCKALQAALRRQFNSMIDHADDFLLKMDRLTEWRQLDQEARKRQGAPVCAIGELRFPPRTCKVTDALLIRWVLKYLNLNLSHEDKFRQLPRGMRHRGVRDFEFQLLHHDIGRFGVDPQALWRTLEKRNTINGEGGALELLKNRESAFFRSEQQRCKGRRDKNGRPLRASHTLTMLAYAAAELYREFAKAFRDEWCGDLSDEDAELLPYICARYGVRPGMDLDRGAMVKTILGIDLDSWTHAYDYENGRPYENRTLEDADDLIVSQVPVPNAMAIRCVRKPSGDEPFKFNVAFRAFLPYERGKMSLRDFYDVTPLIESVKQHDAATKGKWSANAEDHARANAEVKMLAAGVETRGGTADEDWEGFGKKPPVKCEFARGTVNKVIQEIQRTERQDKVLLACAKAYWDRYMSAEVTTAEKNKIKNFNLAEASDIGKFFSTPVIDELGGVKVQMMPNDFARPAYAVVARHIGEIVKATKPMAGKANVYSFYDLWLSLRGLQRRETSIRLALLPAISKFNAIVDDHPAFDGDMGAKLYEYCKNRLAMRSPTLLTREEFDAIVELDKRLRHPTAKGVGLTTINRTLAESALRRYRFLK